RDVISDDRSGRRAHSSVGAEMKRAAVNDVPACVRAGGCRRGEALNSSAILDDQPTARDSGAGVHVVIVPTNGQLPSADVDNAAETADGTNGFTETGQIKCGPNGTKTPGTKNHCRGVRNGIAALNDQLTSGNARRAGIGINSGERQRAGARLGHAGAA